MNPYETPKLVDEYLLFHYGEPGEILAWDFGPESALNFAERTVSETVDRSLLPENPRALDLGCAVGRSSFELSKKCEEVIGIDFSQAFVDAAEEVRTNGSKPYRRLEEAHLISDAVANRPDGSQSDKISFEQGDAMHLREDLGSFDIVHAANLLCRLPEPRKLVDRLPQLVNSGGQLVLTTPCTWLEEFTPKENWPTGSTLDFLKDGLGESFDLQRTVEMPFLIRETRRKFQWTVSQASIWLRC